MSAVPKPLSFVLSAALAATLSSPALCQLPIGDVANAQAQAVKALAQWVADYEGGRFAPHGSLRSNVRLQPRYTHAARLGGFLPKHRDRLTHLDILQKLLLFSEKNPSPQLCDAVLGVASAGLDRSLLDRASHELREAAHWTLMGVKDQGIWFQILRAAAGDQVPVLAAERPRKQADGGVGVGVARRVAALRLLGQRGLPIFRSTLEGALTDPDPRVRLAAAESIRPPWKGATVLRVASVVEGERHPVVSQALVRLLFSMLRRPPEDLSSAQKQQVVRRSFSLFGKSGWRTDMDLLELVEKWPSKAAIPKLIEALDLERQSADELVSAVNKRASPLLRQRAGVLLKAMTGALIPLHDVAGWRKFWAAEKGNIVVPEQLHTSRPAHTQVAFFGVPVTGTSIGFLIDTSGSMDSAPATHGPETGPRRLRAPRTRLEAAKAQLALAAQAMAPESQYFVMTFAEEARCWTQTGIKPGRRATRGVTGLMSRLNAHGGTNLYAGLVTSLEMEGRGFADAELPKIDELFVLSDGQPTTGEVRDTETLLEMVRRANKYAKVRINTVFTGTGPGSELLKRLAEENGGVFVQR
ncbi:MAG: VWA domain-containing protein [Planctomycetota bacterium]